MTQKLRVGDQVMFKGKQHKLTDIQIVYNRFQLSDTSGWLYGTSQIIKRYSEEYLSELERQAEAQRIRADKAEQEYMIQFEKYSNDLRKAAESLGKATTANMSLFESAEVVMQERDKLIKLVNTIDEALDEEFKLGEWDDFMNLIHKEITAYREGSNTDEHTSNSIQSQE